MIVIGAVCCVSIFNLVDVSISIDVKAASAKNFPVVFVGTNAVDIADVVKAVVLGVVDTLIGVEAVGVLPLAVVVDANVSVAVCINIVAVNVSADDASNFCNFCVPDLGFCVEVNLGHIISLDNADVVIIVESLGYMIDVVVVD